MLIVERFRSRPRTTDETTIAEADVIDEPPGAEENYFPVVVNDRSVVCLRPHRFALSAPVAWL